MAGASQDANDKGSQRVVLIKIKYIIGGLNNQLYHSGGLNGSAFGTNALRSTKSYWMPLVSVTWEIIDKGSEKSTIMALYW